MTAERLMLLGGLSAFLLTLRLVYRENLREKYAVLWLAMATFLLGLGLFPGFIMQFASLSHLAYPSAVLFLSLAVIYLFAMSVSISLSRQHRRIMHLTQELALLRCKFEEVQKSIPRSPVGSAEVMVSISARRHDHSSV
jgi:hypothetical protein